MNDILEKSIVLIGGMGVGKTTIAEILSVDNDMPMFSSDALRCEVLESDPDYSFDNQLKIRKEKGFNGEMEYLKPYSNIAINRIIDGLTEPSIIDLGAFFPNQLDENLITKIKQFKNIIWLYSSNIDELLKRRNINPDSELSEIYVFTSNSPYYIDFASKKICIDNKSVEEIVNEIYSRDLKH